MSDFLLARLRAAQVDTVPLAMIQSGASLSVQNGQAARLAGIPAPQGENPLLPPGAFDRMVSEVRASGGEVYLLPGRTSAERAGICVSLHHEELYGQIHRHAGGKTPYHLLVLNDVGSMAIPDAAPRLCGTPADAHLVTSEQPQYSGRLAHLMVKTDRARPHPLTLQLQALLEHVSNLDLVMTMGLGSSDGSWKAAEIRAHGKLLIGEMHVSGGGTGHGGVTHVSLMTGEHELLRASFMTDLKAAQRVRGWIDALDNPPR